MVSILCDPIRGMVSVGPKEIGGEDNERYEDINRNWDFFFGEIAITCETGLTPGQDERW